jgi:hypothetical protein
VGVGRSRGNGGRALDCAHVERVLCVAELIEGRFWFGVGLTSASRESDSSIKQAL